MIATNSLRPVLVGFQVLFTFGAANVGGALAAVRYQDQQVRAAMSAITAADSAFRAEQARVVAEGTPRPAVDPLTRSEQQVLGTRLPAPTFFIDRPRVEALEARAARLRDLSRQLAAVEVQSEVDLQGRVVAALAAIAGDLPAARDAAVDVVPFQAFVDTADRDNQSLRTPGAAQQALDAAVAEDAQLRDATARNVVAAKALQSAHEDAINSVAAAQSALRAAQAVPVLNLTSSSAVVAGLADRLATATTTADFQSIATAAKAQTYALQTLLNSRQAGYDLLAATRDHIDLAQKAGKDVAADIAALVSAAAHLDAAADQASIQAATAEIQAIKNDVDSKYWQAIYGHGKVIVVSLQRQELMALQDGVVLKDTLVTSGRPALPTPPGLYHVFYKSSPYKMHSPWPPGNQYWYPDVNLRWAMEFIEGGYFLHDASWRTQFGPGSNSLNGGTHGCVNVPNAPMEWLYGWTDMGTPVVVLPGDFGSSL